MNTGKLSRVLYLICLLVLTNCNLLISIFLIPFILIINGFFLYTIIASLGIIFGAFFALIIWDIEDLEKQHHILGIVFIPLISIINFVIIMNFASKIGKYLNLEIGENALIVSFLYIIPFLIPYFFILLAKKGR